MACGRAEGASAESSGDASGVATEDGSGAEVENGSDENSGESSGDELLENGQFFSTIFPNVFPIQFVKTWLMVYTLRDAALTITSSAVRTLHVS